MRDVIQEFRAAMVGAGLTPPETVEADGVLHRFDADRRRGKRTGWYVLHLDAPASGKFGCWRLQVSQSWCSKSAEAMTDAERQIHRERMAAMQRQREDDERQRQAEARAECAKLWEVSRPCEDKAHPYLLRKGIKPYGLHVLGEGDAARLLVPVRVGPELVSLQFIGADGAKRFKTGGQVQGAYCAIGKNLKKPEAVIVCEGFATGASLHEATGQPVAVAFHAGNLKAVAQALRARLPGTRLIVAADDDAKTPGNPGLAKAREAAQAVGALLAVPDFGPSRPEGATDFNDLHQLAGLASVVRCIESAAPVDVEAPAEVRPPPGVVLVNGADLVPEPVRWLWPDWLALGKLHLLAGAPGQGKTTIALAMAAAVTSGGRWPDGTRCGLTGNALIWSGEDDPADTLLPRLLAAGADKARCYFVSGTRVEGEVEPFDPARDMLALERRAQEIGGVRLLIVDPVVSAVAGDSHKNTEVRRAMQPIVDLAGRLGAAAVGVTHFSKGGAGGDPATRVVGSIAFTAVARVVLVAAKTKGDDGEERRILVRGKSNIGPDNGGFEYHIEQAEPLPGIHASYVTWGAPVTGTARELLAEPERKEDEGRTAVDAAEDFLRQVLAEGITPSNRVKEEASKAGVSWASVRRAADSVGVIKRRGLDAWYWVLPNLLNQLAQDAQHSNVEQVEQLEPVGPIAEPGKAVVSTPSPEDAEVF